MYWRTQVKTKGRAIRYLETVYDAPELRDLLDVAYEEYGKGRLALARLVQQTRKDRRIS